MSTCQCSVYFYICDLNLEVIEKFQANNYRLPHWKKDCTIFPWKFPEIRPGIFGRMVSAQGSAWNRHGSHIVSTLIRLAGVDGPWWRQQLGISVLIKTGPAAKLLSWQQHNRCHFVSFSVFWKAFSVHMHFKGLQTPPSNNEKNIRNSLGKQTVSNNQNIHCATLQGNCCRKYRSSWQKQGVKAPK